MASAKGMARVTELANNVTFRKGLRAVRIVVLGVGAYKIGCVVAYSYRTPYLILLLCVAWWQFTAHCSCALLLLYFFAPPPPLPQHTHTQYTRAPSEFDAFAVGRCHFNAGDVA